MRSGCRRSSQALDEAAVPASGASRPVVAVERVRLDADLGGQMPDHCWREFGLLVGKAPVLAPVGELRSKPELAGAGQVSQQLQLFSSKRPTPTEFICRPQPLHRLAPIPSRAGKLRDRNGRRQPTWPKHTASRSLGLAEDLDQPGEQGRGVMRPNRRHKAPLSEAVMQSGEVAGLSCKTTQADEERGVQHGMRSTRHRCASYSNQANASL